MKKQMFACFLFLILTISVFHLSIPSVVFGQSEESLAAQVFRRHRATILDEDIQPLLPDVLGAFRKQEIQDFLDPSAIGVILSNPGFLTSIDPDVDYRFVGLLTVDNELRVLFADEQFQILLQTPAEIDRLIRLIPKRATLPGPPAESEPKTLSRVYGNNQRGEIDKPLAQPFVVGVLDQNGNPLQGIAVTFEVAAGGGRLSGNVRGTRLRDRTRLTIDTNEYGQSLTTLTLGPHAGRNNLVVARADGIQRTQTFSATAIDPLPPPKDPEPVVSVGPSTAAPLMYWIGDNRIHYRLPGGREETFELPQDEATLTGGIVVDTEGGKVYWAEQTKSGRGRVQSADLDGTNVQLVRGIHAVPYDLAVGTDRSNKRWVYWTNSNNRIHRIKVDGSGFNGHFMELPNPPTHIAFDQEEFRLYWTERERIRSVERRRIRSVAADGRGDRKPIVEDLDEVGGIAAFEDVVYWTEQTRNGGKARYKKRTGPGDKRFLPTPEGSIPEGIAVDPVGRRVYWTTSDGEIRSAPLTNPTQFVVERGVGPATGITLGGTAVAPASRAAPSISSVSSQGRAVQNTLLANYPNPFNPETWIPYQLSEPADVSVAIYSVNGHLVRYLDLGHQTAGVYQSRSRAAYWDGRNAFGERVASGLYFYTLTAGNFTATRKMLIRK